MTPEAKKAMLDAADAFGTARDRWTEILDVLTERGFSVSLDAVRDHTNCDVCGGSERVWDWMIDKSGHQGVDDPRNYKACPGGSPVTWEAE